MSHLSLFLFAFRCVIYHVFYAVLTGSGGGGFLVLYFVLSLIVLIQRFPVLYPVCVSVVLFLFHYVRIRIWYMYFDAYGRRSSFIACAFRTWFRVGLGGDMGLGSGPGSGGALVSASVLSMIIYIAYGRYICLLYLLRRVATRRGYRTGRSSATLEVIPFNHWSCLTYGDWFLLFGPETVMYSVCTNTTARGFPSYECLSGWPAGWQVGR